MAVTRNASVFRLGAPGDAVTADTAGAQIALCGILATAGVNPGTVIVNDKADGSGAPLFEAYLKSNESMWIEADMWATGGYKANAANPASSVILVYTKDC